jgi:hypothetical protein
MQIGIGTARLTFVRLPDDDRNPAHIVVGATLTGQSAIILRGLWSVDQWEKWRDHDVFRAPVSLVADAEHEDPGVVLKIGAIVPLREMPRATWPAEFQSEEWQSERMLPPSRAGALLPIGTLLRSESRYEFGGTLPDEAIAMVRASLTSGRRVARVDGPGLSV